MSRCENVKMSGCADVQMMNAKVPELREAEWPKAPVRCGDVQMRKFADVQMMNAKVPELREAEWPKTPAR